MVDLDHFKRIDDTYEHDAGDLALKATAKQLLSRLRTSDIACRYGGEELALLLLNAQRRPRPNVRTRFVVPFPTSQLITLANASQV